MYGTSNGGSSLEFILENSTQIKLYTDQTSYPVVKPWKVNFTAVSNIVSDNSFTANCTMTRSSVESNVICDDGSCGVTNIRWSRSDQGPPGYTPLYTE